jgi:hypothetical protein
MFGGKRVDAFDELHLPRPGDPIAERAKRGSYRYYVCYTHRCHRKACPNVLLISLDTAGSDWRILRAGGVEMTKARIKTLRVGLEAVSASLLAVERELLRLAVLPRRKRAKA